ncbi:hypothetical protein ES707_00138 [subsurface metagenome]
MEISLIDRRANTDQPSFDTNLGERISVTLDRDRGLYILSINTNLAYLLTIKMTKADVDDLRRRLPATTSKEKK